MRLSIHLGAKAAQKSSQKISNWRKKITATEQKRLKKTVLDLSVVLLMAMIYHNIDSAQARAKASSFGSQ